MENYTHVLKKRGDVTRVLELFVAFGASPDILIEAHPHIGTNNKSFKIFERKLLNVADRFYLKHV
jgi:uncharacterized FAD-dependent dehydrogenase